MLLMALRIMARMNCDPEPLRAPHAAPENGESHPDSESLADELHRFWKPLPDKPEETPERIVRALWLTASGTPASVDSAADTRLPALNEAASARLRELLERKKSGVPLAHLTGRQRFLGIDFIAGPAALIPRKETEILGCAVLARLQGLARERGEPLVVDLCTGSGNLAIACAHYEPAARVYASDLSHEAVALARMNCEHTGVAGRVEVMQGDLFEPFEDERFLGRCDLLICNPPYIPAAKVGEMPPEISGFEPELAFNGGIYGIAILMKLIRNAPRFLRPGSWLGFEVGEGQGPQIARQIAKNRAYGNIETLCDARGEIRAILAQT